MEEQKNVIRRYYKQISLPVRNLIQMNNSIGFTIPKQDAIDNQLKLGDKVWPFLFVVKYPGEMREINIIGTKIVSIGDSLGIVISKQMAKKYVLKKGMRVAPMLWIRMNFRNWEGELKGLCVVEMPRAYVPMLEQITKRENEIENNIRVLSKEIKQKELSKD